MENTNQNAQVQIFEPSHALDKKVIVVSDTKKEEAVQNATKFMESLEDNFEQRLEQNMLNLKTAFQGLINSTSNDLSIGTKKLFEIVLNLKSEAGSFGFPILSDIGDSLCCFIDELKGISSKDIEIIKLHIEAMNLVVSKNIKTKENSPENEELVNGLLQIAKNRINSLKSTPC